MHQLLDKLHNNLIGHGTLEEHSIIRNTLVVVCKVPNQREIFKVQLKFMFSAEVCYVTNKRPGCTF